MDDEIDCKSDNVRYLNEIGFDFIEPKYWMREYDLWEDEDFWSDLIGTAMNIKEQK